MTATLVDSAGEKEALNCFERDDKTVAYKSCSVNWNNQFFIFGGEVERRQISQLIGYKLKRIADLTFDFLQGECGVMADTYIFLCFHAFGWNDEWRRCRRSSGPLEQFEEVALSQYEHDQIQISCSDSK